ncbi:MAG: 16S rRNA (cytosine(1402)-N(4))-methyltransferase RsmH [Deltaproteobacteria bacterium]|nr:16S rRNA (cytosine(1402)-N(4))-methyltransferase RsmH [Deltaproteobacteria bacterium]
MTAFAHSSVLLAEVLEHLEPRPGAVYVDCTLGGAGHARAVLEASAPDGRLIGIDRDPSALAAAREVLAEAADRVTFVHGRFGDVADHLATLGIARVDGFVVDLGVSSPQLDRADRGFSFMKEGPLDMRMDPTTGQTALELLRDLTIDELGDVLRDYGEERYHRKIARVIKDAIRADTIATTLDLAKLVATCIPMFEQRKSRIHPATRTFQALRIAVNAELDEIEKFLAVFPDLLEPGGRCVVISFHSLEDRLVKHRFRDLAWTSSLPPRLAREAGERVEAVCTPIARKVVATDEETATNPRARSARLRACERTSAPNLPAQSRP